MFKKTLIVAALTLVASGSPALAGPGAEEASVQGSLDKEVIRRVIRQHIGEVKLCYEEQLKTNPSLAGRVMAHFTIGPDGKVTDSSIQETSLKSPACEKCIADAVRGWEFPKPRGGKVVVSYPFVLAASEPK